MPLIRRLRPCVILVLLSGCAKALLAPVSDTWFSQGPESQVVLKRHLHIDLIDGGKALRADFLEQRLVRRAATITLRVPTGPDQRIEAIAADWRTLDGPVTQLNAEDFVAVDRQDQPLGRGGQPAAYVRRLALPAGTLVRWRTLRHQRLPELLPRLELQGPFPINHAELRVRGEGFEQLDLVTRQLAHGTLIGSGELIGIWRQLQPTSAHPYAPGELGFRNASLRWKKSRYPNLIDRMIANQKSDYQLRTLPTASTETTALPCLLRPWGSERLRPESALLATASKLPEGGYQLNVPDAFRRPFRDCTLIQAGEPARLVVKQQDGERVLRLRTSIGAQGQLTGKGQLIYSGAGARQVRQAAINMSNELRRLLQPLAPSLRLGQAKVSGTGPVHLPFELNTKVTALDPSRWLASPLAALSYLPVGVVLGPAIAKYRVEWVFDWPASSKIPPPTGMASVSKGALSAAATWSLGPQRTLRFVRSLHWEPRPMAVEPTKLRQRLDKLRVAALPLPTQ